MPVGYSHSLVLWQGKKKANSTSTPKSKAVIVINTITTKLVVYTGRKKICLHFNKLQKYI